MGKKKPVQLPYEQNVEYQEWKPSETPDTQALRSMSAMPETLAPGLAGSSMTERRKGQLKAGGVRQERIFQTLPDEQCKGRSVGE
jgi:hypothetical protein